MIDMKKFLILFLLAFLLIAPAWAQDSTIETQVDKTSLPLGQSLSLSIIYNNIQPPKADVSSLRGDFDVVGVAESTNINIINGKSSMQYVRKFRLIPKREGEIEIPAFDDGQGNLSQPIKINVVPAGTEVAAPISDKSKQDSASPQQTQFSMTGRVNNNNPYVQQEIIYTVSLIDSGGLQGHEPVFELQNNQDWVIRSLGTPEILPLVVQGKKMREILFKYALFPQKSGKLTIPAVRFEGYTLSRPKKRIDPFADLFGDDLSSSLGFTFAEQNPVILRTKPLEIDVKPVPASNNGNWWLPAKNVMLVDSFEPENSKFMVGEAVHRRVFLKADGVLDNQLPEIKFPNVDGIKQYPEKPAFDMNVENGSVVSLMQVSNVYIPNLSGEQILPEIKVNWFNVLTNKTETAVLPAKKILVTESPNLPKNESQNTTPVVEKTPQPSVQTPSQPQQNQNLLFAAIGIGAFVLGILLTLFIGRKKQPVDLSLHALNKQIIDSAKARDLKTLRDLLLSWGALVFGVAKINNLNELKKLVKDSAFAEQLDIINAFLYAESVAAWDGEKFITLFKKLDIEPKKNAQKKDILPKLYQ